MACPCAQRAKRRGVVRQENVGQYLASARVRDEHAISPRRIGWLGAVVRIFPRDRQDAAGPYLRATACRQVRHDKVWRLDRAETADRNRIRYRNREQREAEGAGPAALIQVAFEQQPIGAVDRQGDVPRR